MNGIDAVMVLTSAILVLSQKLSTGRFSPGSFEMPKKEGLTPKVRDEGPRNSLVTNSGDSGGDQVYHVPDGPPLVIDSVHWGV